MPSHLVSAHQLAPAHDSYVLNSSAAFLQDAGQNKARLSTHQAGHCTGGMHAWLTWMSGPYALLGLQTLPGRPAATTAA